MPADRPGSISLPSNLLSPLDLDSFTDELVTLLTVLAARMRRLPLPTMCEGADA
jgi:hypothetical protein